MHPLFFVPRSHSSFVPHSHFALQPFPLFLLLLFRPYFRSCFQSFCELIINIVRVQLGHSLFRCLVVLVEASPPANAISVFLSPVFTRRLPVPTSSSVAAAGAKLRSSAVKKVRSFPFVLEQHCFGCNPIGERGEEGRNAEQQTPTPILF